VFAAKRGVTPTIRHEIRQRAAIEPVIGRMEADGHDDGFLLWREDG
jgi:hypothetical protein